MFELWVYLVRKKLKPKILFDSVFQNTTYCTLPFQYWLTQSANWTIIKTWKPLSGQGTSIFIPDGDGKKRRLPYHPARARIGGVCKSPLAGNISRREAGT